MAVRDALVVLTRPAGRNEALARQLRELGCQVLCLPVLTLDPVEPGDRDWRAPDAYDLIVFVSGHAVAGYLQGMQRTGQPRAWPRHTLAATVGVASARPLREAGWIPEAQIVHPPTDVAQDSESLWQQLQALAIAPRRVLIVGAQEGRDWLRQRFMAQGCQVERLSVYERRPAQWAPTQVARLRQALADGLALACLLTSGQGVDAFDANLRAAGLTGLYRASGFVTFHQSVARRLQWQAQRAGCGEIPLELCLPDDPAILAALLRLLTR